MNQQILEPKGARGNLGGLPGPNNVAIVKTTLSNSRDINPIIVSYDVFQALSEYHQAIALALKTKGRVIIEQPAGVKSS